MACAKLIKDIDMSSVCYPPSGDVEEKSWTPIGSSSSVWNGTFDGDNHAINNLYISSGERFTGLFGNVGRRKVATIRNIKFNNAIVKSSNSYIAVLVGYVSKGEISGITVQSGSVDSASDYVGGIVGIADYDVKIVECENHANITGKGYVGTIFGWIMNAPTADGYIQKCSNFANIRCRGKYAGGIGGHLNGGTIAACANTVYHGKKCDKITDVYTNDNSIFGEDGAVPHVFEIAGHPDANGLYGDVCINCNANNENIKYIQHFCGIIGNNLKLTYDDGKYYAETVTLTDGEAYNSPVDIEVADFKYIRTFDAYKWQPLYVPFRMSLEQLTANGLSVVTPVDIEVVDETITRLNVQKLKSGSSKANYPSLIRCESDGEKTFELADVTLSAAKEGAIDCMSMTRKYVFNGVYQANKNLASNSEDAINYIIKDGGLVLRTDDDVPAPQSWYMNVTIRENPFGGADEPLSSDAKAMPIYVIGEGYATGIENVNAAEEHIQQGIYDLQGRKLNQEPESGIYIKDGKKYVK